MSLFIFLLIFFFLVFFLRSFLTWRKTGINPLTFSKGDDAHGYIGKVYGFISVLELIVVSIYAFAPSLHKYLLPFWHMRESWRIGIDEINKSELVTSGLFSYSRNPIFLGIMIANFGLFLIIPNAFTLLIVSLSKVSINTQIRLEEAFLEKSHGTAYINYRKKVRRWI